MLQSYQDHDYCKVEIKEEEKVEIADAANNVEYHDIIKHIKNDSYATVQVCKKELQENVCEEETETFIIETYKEEEESQSAKKRNFFVVKVCHICDETFDCKKDLMKHLKLHSDNRSYNCIICGKSYNDPVSLQKHRSMKHSKNAVLHECPHCCATFATKSILTAHMRTHTKERPYHCDICDKFYPTVSYLNRHKLFHVGVESRKFKCEICSKRFKSKSALNAHQVTHTKEKPYQCCICGKSFAMKGALTSHTKYVHTKERNAMCQHCGKKCMTNSDLKQHMRKHTGEKRPANQQCRFCNRKYTSITLLQIHEWSKHTGERPYNCELCDKKFLTANSLKVHLRSHTGERPYKCLFCDRTFITDSNRKVHQRIHTGEKPYVCSFCAMTFTQNSTMRKHVKIHTRYS